MRRLCHATHHVVLLLLLLRLLLLQLRRLQHWRARRRWRSRPAHGRVLAVLAPAGLDETAMQRVAAEADNGMRGILMRVELQKGEASVRLDRLVSSAAALVTRATHLHPNLEHLSVSGKKNAEIAGACVRREIAHVWSKRLNDRLHHGAEHTHRWSHWSAAQPQRPSRSSAEVQTRHRPSAACPYRRCSTAAPRLASRLAQLGPAPPSHSPLRNAVERQPTHARRTAMHSQLTRMARDPRSSPFMTATRRDTVRSTPVWVDACREALTGLLGIMTLAKGEKAISTGLAARRVPLSPRCQCRLLADVRRWTHHHTCFAQAREGRKCVRQRRIIHVATQITNDCACMRMSVACWIPARDILTDLMADGCSLALGGSGGGSARRTGLARDECAGPGSEQTRRLRRVGGGGSGSVARHEGERAMLLHARRQAQVLIRLALRPAGRRLRRAASGRVACAGVRDQVGPLEAQLLLKDLALGEDAHGRACAAQVRVAHERRTSAFAPGEELHIDDGAGHGEDVLEHRPERSSA